MRWAATAVAVAALLVMGCGTKGAVNDALERSTAPLLVPTGEWRDSFEFTAPPGSTDLYQLRWNFRAGATDIISGWQVTPGATYDQAAIAEGPGQELVDEILLAASDSSCDIVDATAAVRMCSYPDELTRGGANVYLVRDADDHTLVIEYLNFDGERSDYNSASLEARFITAAFDRVPIDGDIDDYLVYIY